MSPQEIAASLRDMNPNDMATMNHSDLYIARGMIPSDLQNKISPYEHRAFAREATRENPLLALPIAAGTLAYQPYKMLKGQSRSGASWNQIGHGLLGVGEGLWGPFQEQMQSIQNRIRETGIKTSPTDLAASLQSYPQGSNRANTIRR